MLAREDIGDSSASLMTGKRLVAYVVPGQEPATQSVNCEVSLSRSYRVHGSLGLRVSDALPLTPNGKIDRKALPAPDQNRPELGELYVAPRTPVEEMIAEIWAEVLKLDKVGVHDNFFDLGGHSLLATQAMSRICQVLQVKLPLRCLFEGPTVAELAERIEEARSEEQRLLIRPLYRSPESEICLFLLPSSGYGFWISMSRTVRFTTYRVLCGWRRSQH